MSSSRISKWNTTGTLKPIINNPEESKWYDNEVDDSEQKNYDDDDNEYINEDRNENYASKLMDDDNNDSEEEEDDDINHENAQLNEQIPLFISFTDKKNSTTSTSKGNNNNNHTNIEPLIHIVPQQEPIDSSFLRSTIPPSLLKAVIPSDTNISTSYEGQRKLHQQNHNGRSTSMNNKNKVINQPVTFRAQVKSSGYGTVAPRKPGWAKAAAQRAQSSSSLTTNGNITKLMVTHSYRYQTTTTNNIPNQIDEDIFGITVKSTTSRLVNSSSSSSTNTSNSVSASSTVFPMGPVSSVAYSYDGTNLAVASYDGSLHTIRLGLNAGSSLNYNTDNTDFGNNDNMSIQSISPPSLIQLRLMIPSTKHTSINNHQNTNTTTNSNNSSSSSNISNPNSITSLSWSHGTYNGLSSRMQQQTIDNNKKLTTKSSIDTSTRHRLLLTSGNDNTVSVWAGASGRTDPVFTIRVSSGSTSTSSSVTNNRPSSTSNSSRPSVQSSSSTTNTTTNISASTFYYIDKFILCASGDNIYAYSWLLNNDSYSNDEINPTKRVEEDVVRLRNKSTPIGKSSLIMNWKGTTNGSTINNLAVHNTFRSPLIFTTSLDRSVRIYDCGQTATPQEIFQIPDAHSRSIHSLILPTTSTFAEVSGTAMNCFLTSSTDSVGGLSNGGSGLLRLWDLRINKCVRQLTGNHVNRVHTCSATFSPDLMYIATGSEDRSVVIYDLRKDGECVMKLRGATDTVTSVNWHPLLPHIVSGSLDGNVRFYRTTTN